MPGTSTCRRCRWSIRARLPNYIRAVELLDRAVALDPTYAPALALAAWAHEKRHLFGGPQPSRLRNRRRSGNGAGGTRCRSRSRRCAGARSLRLAAHLLQGATIPASNSSSAPSHSTPTTCSVLDLSGAAHCFAGDLDEVIACATRGAAAQSGGAHPLCVHDAASPRRTTRPAGTRRRSISQDASSNSNQTTSTATFTSPSAYAQLGRIEEARRHVAAVLRIRPDFTIPR